MVKLARPQVMIKLSTKHKQGLRRPMKSPNNEDREKKQLSILRLGQHLELLCHTHQCTYRDRDWSTKFATGLIMIVKINFYSIF